MASINNRDDIAECLSIMKELPDYFNEKGLKLFQEDCIEDKLVIIKPEDEIIGFAALKKKYLQVYEISWMAVKKEFQRKGIGTRLISECERISKEAGKKVLMVKTLAETIDYKPYSKTRAFYEKNGFIPIEIIKEYSEWGPEHDCKIYIKMI